MDKHLIVVQRVASGIKVTDLRLGIWSVITRDGETVDYGNVRQGASTMREAFGPPDKRHR